MRLTTFTDYSLRVLMYLAVEPERRATIGEIASVFGISENHLVKVVHALGKRGWLETVRGRGGGITLALPADEISLGRVVRDTEGVDMPAECFSPTDTDCVLGSVCRLKGVLNDAVRAFYASLDRYTLQDITTNRHALVKALRIHPL